MANIQNRSFIPSRLLTSGKVLFSILAVLALGVYVNAQTVVRTNGGTETATGTDVSVVQKADGYASGDVMSVSGTSATNLAPFSTSVRVESSSNYTVTDFTVQSATGDKQYIGALPNSRNYVLKLANTNYNLTFKNVEFQNNDIPQNTKGIFLIMDQATSTVTLNLDNASFTKYQASGDGNYGGIINSTGDLTIYGTNTVSFYGNGSESGGAIFANKTLTIDCDEILFGNNASNNSGAIRNGGALNITGSKVTFNANSARNNGGSIYSSSTISMTGKGDNSVLTFTGNTAKNEGGVIYSTGNGIDLYFNTITFSGNTADNFGGAIRFNNTNTNYKVSITGETVTFDNNTAQKQNGGAIHTNASVQLNGTSENSVFTFSNNTAPKGNSGAIVAVGSVEFSTGSFIFQNNIAGGIAGAIEARKGITFSGYNTSATFTGNTAGTEGNDLYLSNANSVLTFMDGGTYSFDGGIYLAEDSQSTVINQAQVTIAGRSNVSNNNYQLQTVNIFNGGKLTANLDNIDSLTGKFNLGNDGSAGTLEFNVGADSAKELTQQRDMFDINGGFAGSVVKSGAGTLTLAGDFGYYGDTTVSGGTLLLPAGYTLNTSKVTIETGATLQTSADLWAANVVVNNGSKFVIGETYESAEISIVELTLNGGTVHFDLNDFISYNGSYIYDMDQLFTDSVTPYSGVVDLTFNSASAEDWWQVVKNSDEGVPLIIAYDFAEEFDPDNFTVSVNGTPSNNWALAAQDDGIYLFAQGDEPTPGEPWYFANTGDIHLDSWTIDGTNKQGAQFTQGDNDATFEGGVTMDADGEFNIEANKNLTLAGEVTGEGGVTKTGEGTLTLTNANSYTGGTTISAGKVVLSENGTLGNGDIQNDATLEFAHDSDQTLDKTISGDGSVLKTGAGTLTFDVDQEYYGETTVSGGTLILPVGRNLFSSQVTIKSGGTFQLGWFIDDTDVIVEQGGNFVPAFEDCGGLMTVGSLTLDGGTISLDFFETDLGYDNNYEALMSTSGSLNLYSGTIDLSFVNSTEDDWWEIANSGEGLPIIYSEIFDNYEDFNPSAFKVTVNGAASNRWTLTAYDDGIYLLAIEGPQGDPWYYANTDDITLDSWTIDGTNKQGVQFTEGGDSATFAGADGVTLETDGEFNIGAGKNLTISSVVSGDGGVTKTGAGTLKFTGDTTYTGVTNISGGTLEVSNNFTSSSALTGSGTLKLSGDKKFFNIGDGSGFTGTVQVFDENISANSRVQLAGANGETPVNIDLSNATVELNGNATSGKYSELAFYKGGSSLKIGTLNGNRYGRILNIDSSSDAAYNDLTVGSGTFAGEIGREDAAGSQWSYVNKINLIKTGDGTFTFSGMPYYFGETNIQGGVLKFVNDNETGNKMFNRSKALKGSGTLQVVGNTNNWVCFAIDADASAPQEFSGTLDVSGNFVFYQNTNLGNATLHVAENSFATMHGGNTKNLTVKQLNTEAGSKVRISHANPGEGNFVTLTVGSGTVNGDLGETAYNQYYNWVKLNKVSDGSTDGGTLTLAGAFLYTGETTVSGGTLKLTGNAVVANGKMTVEDNGTLEYNVAGGTKTLAITEQNAIYSTGQIVKTGDGTLQLDAVENSIDAKSLELVEGRLDLKGSMKGDLLVNGGVFSPGNSVGEANVTGNVTITDDGAILFEFSSYDEGLFDVLNIVNGTTENAFTAGDNTIQLYFGSGDAADWAAALEDDPDGYLLVSDNNFSSLGNLSDWLGTNKDLFGLEGKSDGLYLVAAGADPGPGPGPGPGPEPGSGVPEPSTWALMALGVLGLLLRKRVRS